MPRKSVLEDGSDRLHGEQKQSSDVGPGSMHGHTHLSYTPRVSSAQKSNLSDLPAAPTPCPSTPTLMANFDVDPRPHVPRGFALKPNDPARAQIRLRSFLGTSMDHNHESVAIAVLVPEVAPEDFNLMARALRRYLAREHRILDVEIHRCPMGAAFVT
ncbi:hypothetical protein ACP4OV_011234 [Aristida adscensionis]